VIVRAEPLDRVAADDASPIVTVRRTSIEYEPLVRAWELSLASLADGVTGRHAS
jgi:hypothetical protein